MDVPFSNKFLMPCCVGCSSDDDYDDFGHFIFKAQCFQGSRGERVAATSCHPPLQTFTVSSLPILSFRAPWLVGGCPNDLSLDWGARRIEAPRGWTSYGVGRIDLWLPYKDRLTFLSTVIFINISHRSTGEIWSLKLRVTTLIRPTRKVQM